MKRSQINREISHALDFFASMNFHLPVWAYWSPDQWKDCARDASEVIDNQLGWDLTDFGSGDFYKRGLLLFTIRNGNPERDGKSYCEKVMIVREKQVTPMHYHYRKMEDIINRGGGNLVMELYHNPENVGQYYDPERAEHQREDKGEGPGVERLGPGFEREVPGVERKSPGEGRLGPTDERLVPGTERLGPVEQRLVPGTERLGRADERLVPGTERLGPGTQILGPGAGRTGLPDMPIGVRIDGMVHAVQPGEALRLLPGQSICLPPLLYHRFYGEEGSGPVLVGEVSAVNDDRNDNHFYEPVGRFPEIREDEDPRYLLIGDYRQYVQGQGQ